jgi:hypothetical protein
MRVSVPPPGSAFLQSLCVGVMPQVPESGSCKGVSAGRDIQSHRAPLRAADEMRLGLQRRWWWAGFDPGHDLTAYWPQYARTPHNMPQAAAGSDYGDRRGRCVKAKRGRPPGRLLCGWRCGSQLRASKCGRIPARSRNCSHAEPCAPSCLPATSLLSRHERAEEEQHRRGIGAHSEGADRATYRPARAGLPLRESSQVITPD